MTRMTVKEEQRSSMRAVYEGSDVLASFLLAMARACATKRSLSSWTSYKKGLVDSGKSCGVLQPCCEPFDRSPCSHTRVRGCVYANVIG